ncbi:hypothetical protein GCM10029964_060990 [Kibdelosporangium lantanae]
MVLSGVVGEVGEGGEFGDGEEVAVVEPSSGEGACGCGEAVAAEVVVVAVAGGGCGDRVGAGGEGAVEVPAGGPRCGARVGGGDGVPERGIELEGSLFGDDGAVAGGVLQNALGVPVVVGAVGGGPVRGWGGGELVDDVDQGVGGAAGAQPAGGPAGGGCAPASCRAGEDLNHGGFMGAEVAQGTEK